MLSRAEIIERVKALGFSSDQYWVCAGAALVIHGVRDGANDIDIACTTELFETLRDRGWRYSKTRDGKGKLEHDIYEFLEDWSVDGIEVVDGVSVATLPGVRKQKVWLGREKDMRDIALIDAFLREQTERQPL